MCGYSSFRNLIRSSVSSASENFLWGLPICSTTSLALSSGHTYSKSSSATTMTFAASFVASSMLSQISAGGGGDGGVAAIVNMESDRACLIRLAFGSTGILLIEFVVVWRRLLLYCSISRSILDSLGGLPLSSLMAKLSFDGHAWIALYRTSQLPRNLQRASCVMSRSCAAYAVFKLLSRCL